MLYSFVSSYRPPYTFSCTFLPNSPAGFTRSTTIDLAEYLQESGEEPEEIVLVGVCTDICVISNALLLKAFFPETRITVAADCCAGVTPESHERALAAMETCQVHVVRGE